MMHPDAWTRTTIGAIASVTSGGTPSRKTPAYWGGDVPWVTTSLIDFNTIEATEEHITQLGVDNSSAKVFPKGTLLMAMFGQGVTRGKVAMLGIDAAFNQACVAIVPKNGESTRFLFHTLATRYEEIRKLSNTGSQENLNAALIKSINILLPESSEIEEIVLIADCWDRGIRQLSDLIAAKRRFKHGLMQQLLTGNQRFPEFKKSSFVEYHVGDVLRETFRPVVWDDEELYRLASIRRHSGGLFWREALPGRQIKVKKLHSLCECDFLISHIQAAYGAMGLVPAEFAGGKVSDMYTILTPKVAGTIDMRYIDYLSQMKRMRHQAYLACNGFFAERLRLNFDPAEFMKQKILLPESVKEQRKIADLLDTLVREIRTLERELDALKSQKKGLMQKLLTGQVRVKL